jgi:hypothetical protein
LFGVVHAVRVETAIEDTEHSKDNADPEEGESVVRRRADNTGDPPADGHGACRDQDRADPSPGCRSPV